MILEQLAMLEWGQELSLEVGKSGGSGRQTRQASVKHFQTHVLTRFSVLTAQSAFPSEEVAVPTGMAAEYKIFEIMEPVVMASEHHFQSGLVVAAASKFMT